MKSPRLVRRVAGAIRQALSAPARRRNRRYAEEALDAAWEKDHHGFQVRRYRDHAAYVAHQRAKRERWDTGALADHDQRFRAALRERLSRDAPIAPGMAVLCLGARMGGEVAAFRDLGCFAVGIDLNPGAANPYVLPGDFHELPFPPGCVDVVFTNSLDHASDIDRIVAEVLRVLKPLGLLIVEAVRGSAEGVAPKFYESLFWGEHRRSLAIHDRSGIHPGGAPSVCVPLAGRAAVLPPEGLSAARRGRRRARKETR